ncbi:MAG: beta-lactamase family protein, partial [Phycisphaerae bacterium]|nr:beta-lactamase family protein [Phycisphaerae bacterium]
DAIFDLASLTKPMATAMSIMILCDRGLLSLDDPVVTHLPALAGPGTQQITIRQCLLHTAGFVPDNPLSDYIGSRQEMIHRILASRPSNLPGKKFAYSDVGYIVLGELVAAVSGRRLDDFAQCEIFLPLGMKDTCFLPPQAWADRFVPTERREGRWMLGEVHDPRAFALGGVAGHAGLFGTAADIERFARMILNRGELDGVRIVRRETIEQMICPQPVGEQGDVRRTPGFDNSSSYSSPRGAHFSRQSFGHTGWTGTSLWIDPTNDCYVILLTNRVHPDGRGDVKQLRYDIATAAARCLQIAK